MLYNQGNHRSQITKNSHFNIISLQQNSFSLFTPTTHHCSCCYWRLIKLWCHRHHFYNIILIEIEHHSDGTAIFTLGLDLVEIHTTIFYGSKRFNNIHQVHNVLWGSIPKSESIKNHYETKHYNLLQRHSSLTPIYLYINWMNFDVMTSRNSSLQFDVSYSTKQRSLHTVLWYDVLVNNSECEQAS